MNSIRKSFVKLAVNISQFIKMKNIIKLTFIIIFTAIFLTGCNNSNPLSPEETGNGGEPEPETIKTPRYMRIESISVTGFNKNKSNGDYWDWHPTSSTVRKPDIHVILQRDGNYFPAFWSDERTNANYTSTYVFTKAASEYDGELPFDMPYSRTYNVHLIDEDSINDNDKMGYVVVKPSSIYGKDNATNFNKKLSRNGITIKVIGAWVY